MVTPDFAILEGPPGSGKTTAICELILQLVLQGKRVLLCASTHVAVDNVLERLMDEKNSHRDNVIPVRIGDRRNVSEAARKWQLEEFIRTERSRLLKFLRGQKPRSKSQQTLFDALQSEGSDLIQRLVLEASNLVCGTTIGILQHPLIKQNRQAKKPTVPTFDVLIIDEASKTPFQEFLVPALLAKRWVIVGDPKQLSPYVDDEAMAVNVEACLSEPSVRNACIDVFSAGQRGKKFRSTLVISDEEETYAAYHAQAKAREVELASLSNKDEEPQYASIVIGTSEEVAENQKSIPLDISTVRGNVLGLEHIQRRATAWRNLAGTRRFEEPLWESEVGWRLARHYEQRFSPGRSSARLFDQVQDLLPVEDTGVDPKRIWRDVDQVRRVALPSILELLRYGFHLKDLVSIEDLEPGMILSGRVSSIKDFGVFINIGLGRDGMAHISRLSHEFVDNPRDVVQVGQQVTVKVETVDLEKNQIGLDMRINQRQHVTTLTQGLAEETLEQRHVLLEWQHRMHPEISLFSREHIYDGNALQDPDDMEEKRVWSFSKYDFRSVWLDVRGQFYRRYNSNRKEAEVIIKELKAFHEWARGEKREDGRPWEVAILTFYRGQEREIRWHLRKMTGSYKAFRHFKLGPKNHPEVTIELCTVDRFQGHEADLVFLSFANTYPTVFLESPNRLNVALTRARYQRVIVGNRAELGWFKRGRERR